MKAKDRQPGVRLVRQKSDNQVSGQVGKRQTTRCPDMKAKDRQPGVWIGRKKTDNQVSGYEGKRQTTRCLDR